MRENSEGKNKIKRGDEKRQGDGIEENSECTKKEEVESGSRLPWKSWGERAFFLPCYYIEYS